MQALLAQGVTEAGWLAHARRKFYDLCANNRSQIAEEALRCFGKLYDVERDADATRRETGLRYSA
ncbi:mobile element protein [Caldimonas brevitalea]|uniref:Mobile element protein n=1 Tax=Caldimonas brevitalea TaxID=413882 RepID=A0A0G3BX86_9BURK|nr:mobile element protein [Caldimonas brevitalea]